MLKPVRVLILHACGVSDYAKIMRGFFLQRGCVVKFITDRNLFETLAASKNNYDFAIIAAEEENQHIFNPNKFALPTTIFTPTSYSHEKTVDLLQLYAK